MESQKDYTEIANSVLEKSKLKGNNKLLAGIILTSFARVVQNREEFKDNAKDEALYRLLHDELTGNGFSFKEISVNGRLLHGHKEFFQLPFYTLKLSHWWQGMLYSPGLRPNRRLETFDGPNVEVDFWPHEWMSRRPELIKKYKKAIAKDGSNVHAIVYLRSSHLLMKILELARECHTYFPENQRAKFYTMKRSALTGHLVGAIAGAANLSAVKK